MTISAEEYHAGRLFHLTAIREVRTWLARVPPEVDRPSHPWRVLLYCGQLELAKLRYAYYRGMEP